jgi:hypothetical protein
VQILNRQPWTWADGHGDGLGFGEWNGAPRGRDDLVGPGGDVEAVEPSRVGTEAGEESRSLVELERGGHRLITGRVRQTDRGDGAQSNEALQAGCRLTGRRVACDQPPADEEGEVESDGAMHRSGR